MNILFVSQYYPDSIIKTCLSVSKIGLNWAAHNLSLAIIRGFEECRISPYILNIAHMGSFPAFAKCPWVPGCQDRNVQSISYINIAYYKRIDTCRRVTQAILKWCQETEDKKIILFYNINYLSSIIPVKKAFPDTKAVLLLTDLPEYRAHKNKFLSAINEWISPEEKERKGNRFNYIDGYVLLNSQMIERLPIGEKPWMLMEGIYYDEITLSEKEKEPHKILMYTGNLDERYGIGELLDAFKEIEDSDYRLWIRGNGRLASLVKERSQEDSRILYLNQMSREELMEREQKSTLLINPVLSSQEFTQFFFPSKTLEYMASGTPTLMAKLSCMPQEYHSHLFFFDDETPTGIAKRIQEICSKPQEELQAFGQSASQFVLQEKNPQKQVSKILNFFYKL